MGHAGGSRGAAAYGLHGELVAFRRLCSCDLAERADSCEKDSEGSAWQLKGKTAQMTLDMGKGTVAFACGGERVEMSGLPSGRPLTAAVCAYNNTATATLRLEGR